MLLSQPGDATTDKGLRQATTAWRSPLFRFMYEIVNSFEKMIKFKRLL